MAPLAISGLLLCAASASANQIPGATYAGTDSSGGQMRFTVNAAGSAVSSYRFDDVAGDTCTFVAEGDDGVWPGAPIAADAFAYNLYDAIIFSGTFPASGSASGTLKLHNDAVPATKPACDSGTVTWTATTTASAPPPGSPSVGSPGTGSPVAKLPLSSLPAKAPAHRTYGTTVLLRTSDRKLLTGRLKSGGAGCIASRAVTVKRGLRTVGRAKTNAAGYFKLKRTPAMRGQRIRMTVAAKHRPALTCGAGSSKSVRLAGR